MWHIKSNCCVYFGSGIFSRHSVRNKLFLGTTAVLKVSLTALFTCAQQKASGYCCAQGCFQHSEVHHRDPLTQLETASNTSRYLRNICFQMCFSLPKKKKLILMEDSYSCMSFIQEYGFSCTILNKWYNYYNVCQMLRERETAFFLSYL